MKNRQTKSTSFDLKDPREERGREIQDGISRCELMSKEEWHDFLCKHFLNRWCIFNTIVLAAEKTNTLPPGRVSTDYGFGAWAACQKRKLLRGEGI